MMVALRIVSLNLDGLVVELLVCVLSVVMECWMMVRLVMMATSSMMMAALDALLIAASIASIRYDTLFFFFDSLCILLHLFLCNAI